ncbi:MAG: FAD-binding oxidoreductase [Deltaproteobacteria bacterium]|nr:FAD-binding oxidoreductase [Deltaproteobacteria bacterium]
MNDAADKKRSFWGWGWAHKFPDRETRKALGAQLPGMLGFAPTRLDDAPRIEHVALPEGRLPVPDALAEFVTNEAEARIRHTYGRAYPDVLRGFRGDFEAAPDLVARPRTEAEVEQVLAWATDARVAALPFGGGTSVVGGVEPKLAGDYAGALSLDMGALNRVLEIEKSSLHARIQAGALGPEVEAGLAREGLTLRHFPQSFEFSTLGGWIATRAGGHFATLYTHIDDLVASTRMLTPRGVMESRRLPGSGAGPSPDRLVCGSEGALGVITEAWMRVRLRPTFRAQATLKFANFEDAVEACRELSQSGLYPTNCRLLDAREAGLNMVSMDGRAVLIVAFEGADHPLGPWIERALEIARAHGGDCPDGAKLREGEKPRGDGAAEAWRGAFLEAPYLMNVMASLGVVVDTFETACPWDSFAELHAGVIHDVRDAMKRECGGGFVSCRFTHVYPDGPAPYFTFIAPGRGGGELEQWAAIKQAASEALVRHGGTITHHHAIGRTHLPYVKEQRPSLFTEALRGAKRVLDPAGIMNPGAML